MYETNEYVTAELGLRYPPGHRRAPGRRVWLAVIPTVAALLVLLFVLAAACRAGSGEQGPPAGAAGTPTAGPSASPGSSAPEPGPEASNGGGGGAAGGGNPGGGAGSGDGNPDPEEPVEPEPVEPLSIQASLNSAVPGGSCSASGTLGVSGGEYPLTVDYEWQRVRLVNGQLSIEAVSPALSVTFDEPGAKTVQINNLPSDGPNLWIAVTAPKQVASHWVVYDSCGDGPDMGPGGIAS